MPTERRKNPRVGLAIPIKVQGFHADGTTWEEMTTTADVSVGGTSFPLTHEADLGQVLLLTLPLPKRLRQFDLMDASYRVYSLVRSVRRRTDQPRVGVMFFGKHPPRGFSERPAARFLLPSDSIVGTASPQGLREGHTPYTGMPRVSPSAAADAPSQDTMVGANGGAPPAPRPDESSPGRYTPPAMTAPSTIPKGRSAILGLDAGGPNAPGPAAADPAAATPGAGPKERRAHARSDVFVNFTIQLVDEWGVVLQEELTVADNIGRGGARVMTTLGFQLGDVVLLQEAGGGFATRAQVQGITKVQPTIERLHLQFLDRQAPDRMLKQ